MQDRIFGLNRVSWAQQLSNICRKGSSTSALAMSAGASPPMILRMQAVSVARPAYGLAPVMIYNLLCPSHRYQERILLVKTSTPKPRHRWQTFWVLRPKVRDWRTELTRAGSLWSCQTVHYRREPPLQDRSRIRALAHLNLRGRSSNMGL